MLGVLNQLDPSLTFTNIKFNPMGTTNTIAVQIKDPIIVERLNLSNVGSTFKGYDIVFNEEYRRKVNENHLAPRTFMFTFNSNANGIVLSKSMTILTDNFEELKSEDYTAGHVSGRGKVCMGTFAANDDQSAREFNIINAINMLRTHNPSSAYNQLKVGDVYFSPTLVEYLQNNDLMSAEAIKGGLDTPYGRIVPVASNASNGFTDGVMAIPEHLKALFESTTNDNNDNEEE